tara:strand:+ start:1188 stop:1892 length:705 start_codon:yes stop_codon:yes gene_type:complete
MELTEVQAFLKENAERADVKEYVTGLAGNGNMETARVETYLGTDEGQKLLQPHLDRNFNQGLDSWKKNHLDQEIQGRVDEEVGKRVPAEETPQDKTIRELKESQTRLEQQIQKQNVDRAALEMATGKGLAPEWAEHFVGSSAEETKARFDRLLALLEADRVSTKESILKDNSRQPHAGTSNTGTVKNPWSKEHMNMTEQGRIAQENPDLAKQLMAAAGYNVQEAATWQKRDLRM